MTTFVSSGVHVILTSPPLLLTSWHPVRLVVCSLVTPLTTRGTDVLISTLVGSSSLDMLCLTSRISPTPPPLHLPLTPSWSPCSCLTRWFSHPCLSVLSLQVFLVHRHCLQCLLSRHARPRCLLPRHARTRCPLPRPARTRCLLPRHARPRRSLSRHARPQALLRATPSRCRCTGVVRCWHRHRSLRLRHRRLPRAMCILYAFSSAARQLRLHRPLHRSRRHRHHHRHLHGLALVWSHQATTRPSSIGTLVTFIPW